MALDRRGRIAFGVVVVGFLLTVSGFVCLLVALMGSATWTTLVVAGAICVGVGFVAALIAALYLTVRNDDQTGYDIMDEGKKKHKPSLGAVPPLESEFQTDKVPSLSNTSKDHIYRMTLNLGSVDVQSKAMKQKKEMMGTETINTEDCPSPESLQPGLAEGTKQFKD